MSKIKHLKMTGETEEFFERWREEWDEIVTAHLPKVEELLYDAEENADKYRFKSESGACPHRRPPHCSRIKYRRHTA